MRLVTLIISFFLFSAYLKNKEILQSIWGSKINPANVSLYFGWPVRMRTDRDRMESQKLETHYVNRTLFLQ